MKQIHDALDVPICTGEDIYLMEPFEVLCKNSAVDIIQPDLSTSGGILETKRLGDMAQKYGVPMAMHMAGTPVCAFANAHCAAATENFLVLEIHSVDVPWWDSLVDGVEKPISNFAVLTEEVYQHLLAPTSPVVGPTPVSYTHLTLPTILLV